MIPGIIAGAAVADQSDPYFANVITLFHFDGTNGSTTIPEETGTTWSVAGAAQLSTAQRKFGPTSLALNGTNASLQQSTSADWSFPNGTDFTIEAWVWQDSTGAAADTCILGVADNGVSSGLLLGVYFGQPYVAHTAVSSVVDPSTISSNTWHHIAASREGSTMRLFVDGVLVSSGADAVTYPDATARVGSVLNPAGGAAVAYFKGYVDDLRVTKGVARYTANFTPPTKAFPNY